MHTTGKGLNGTVIFMLCCLLDIQKQRNCFLFIEMYYNYSFIEIFRY